MTIKVSPEIRPAEDAAALEGGSPEAAQPAAPPCETIGELCRRATAEERSRIAAIMQSIEAEGRRELARCLAVNTDMDAEAAIAVLKTSPRQAHAAATTAQDQFSRHLRQSQGARAPTDAPLH